MYLLLSQRVRRTYVGIALDPARRLAQHNGEALGGAKSTRSGRPWAIARVWGPYGTRGEALRVELSVKRLRGRARLGWTPRLLATRVERQVGSIAESRAGSEESDGR